MSATDDLGPHLLGRKPSPPDPRDYQLGDYLTAPKAASVDPLDVALADLLGSWEGHKTKHWAQVITDRVKALSPTPPDPGPTPPPTPDPTPTPPQDVTWTDAENVLDQGQTPHCVGFGSAQWGNTLPIDDRFTNADGDAIYYECKVIDGEPFAEDGSSARSSARALKARGRLKTYAFAAAEAEIRAWVHDHGPVMFATDWDDPMFTPDANGYVTPDGNPVGGHYYVIVGDLVSEDAYLCLNSWGDWGPLHGLFKMTRSSVASLLARQGEAVAAVELP